MNMTQMARVCHEVNRAYCQALGDLSQVPWDEASDAIRKSALQGVDFALNNPEATPEAQHNNWLVAKVAAGWKYGPKKDETILEHPGICAYEKLPLEQRIKDNLFQAVVKTLNQLREDMTTPISRDTRNNLPLSISPQILQNYAIFVLSRSKPMGSLTTNLHHASTGMATEAGEALSTTKKMWIYGQDLGTLNKEGKSNQENLIEEAGDALFYTQMMCNLLGCTLLDLIAANEAKLRLRYPNGYSDQAATERADKSATVAPWKNAQAGGEDIDKACREN